jgi:hypothetical protein
MLAAPTGAQADVCGALDTGPIPNPAQVGCDVAKAGIKAVSHPDKAAADIVTAPIRAAGDTVMQGVTSWVAGGAGWLVDQAGELIDRTTTPRLTSPWFVRQYDATGALAALFALPLLLLAVLQGVVRRDGGLIVRAAFVQLPLAFVLAAMAVTVVALVLGLVDAMCAEIAVSVGKDANAFFSDAGKGLAALSAATNSPVPLFAIFLGALVAAIGAFFVWVELVIRSAAIYVAVLFLPLSFVAMIWPATARWCRRLLELLFAVIFAKFVIVAIMALAAAGLGHSRSQDAFQGVLAGAALMILAAFSPLVWLRLIPLAEAAAHAAPFRSGSGSSTLGPIASPAAVMRRVTDANWGSRAGGALRAAPAAGAGPGVAAAALGGAAAVGGAVRSRAENIGAAGANGGSQPAGPAELRYAGAGAHAPSPVGPGATAENDAGRQSRPDRAQSSPPPPAGQPAAPGGPRPLDPPSSAAQPAERADPHNADG